MIFKFLKFYILDVRQSILIFCKSALGFYSHIDLSFIKRLFPNNLYIKLDKLLITELLIHIFGGIEIAILINKLCKLSANYFIA